MIKLTPVFFISYTLFTTTYAMDTNNPVKKIGKKQLTPPFLKRRYSDHNRPLPVIGKSNSKENCLPDLIKKENFLLDAVQENNPEKVLMILKPDINQQGENGHTPLIVAVMKGNEQIVHMLFEEKQLDPNIQNIWHMTALHYAALNGNHKIIKKFMGDPRVDASITNKNNHTKDNHCKENKNKDSNSLIEANNTARELLSGTTDQDYLMRMLLFARITLDKEINKQIPEMRLACVKSGITAMRTDIDAIKERILKTHSDQTESNDRKLPEETQLPDYATDEFIEQMLTWRINKQKAASVMTINNSHNRNYGSTQ